jgi:hypothetical protein
MIRPDTFQMRQHMLIMSIILSTSSVVKFADDVNINELKMNLDAQNLIIFTLTQLSYNNNSFLYFLTVKCFHKCSFVYQV